MIKIDAAALITLHRQKLGIDSVLEFGKEVFIRDNANISLGGTAVDVTDTIHPENIRLAERAARLAGLWILPELIWCSGYYQADKRRQRSNN